MRKEILFFIMMIFIILLGAERQSFETIEKVANNFIQNTLPEYSILETYRVQKEAKTNAFIFNLEPLGFVAVTADSQLPPVLAYSSKNQLHETEKDENLFYDMLAQDIQNRLEYYKIAPQEAEENEALWNSYLQQDFFEKDFQQWPPAGTTLTDGWVQTSWNQSGVYNQLCPLDNSGQRSVVGCVATAMAMIIDYHEYMGNVSFSNADDYYSGYSYPYMYIDNDHLERDFPSFPELNVLLNDVKNRYLNNEPLMGIDKAALSFACGIATEMNYSSNGSGTWTEYVASALLNKFDYDSAQYIDNYGSSFYQTLKQNMKTMKPAEMSIYTAGWNDGHAIICDGYNTDDFYHLNYGWGTSNASCWYSLPYGMPSNYSIIGGAVVNIQGGNSPISVHGQVNVSGVSPVGTYIRLEGEHTSEVYVTNSSGSFEIPAIWPGFYTVTAFLEGRFYYQTFDLEIHTNNQMITIQLDEYDEVTGVVNAPVNAENCFIHFYQDGDIKYSGLADENGNFAIPEVFPGTYTATASLPDSYFQSKEIEITADNQVVQFDLEEYPGEVSFAYSLYPTDLFTFLQDYEMSLGIKITSEEWQNLEHEILGGVRFIAPINTDEGELYAQIWRGNDLLQEKEISDFSKGEWISTRFDVFSFDSGSPYFVGYKIISQTGDFAYHDNTPKVQGKGSFLRISHWSEISDALLPHNLCIEAEFLSQTYGTVNGNVTVEGSNENLQHVTIKTGTTIAHPADDGSFTMDLQPGTHELIAYFDGYVPSEPQLIEIAENEVLDEIVLEITSTEADESIVIPTPNISLTNYPNPFNPNTTIHFALPVDSKVELCIYNVKGQLVNTLWNRQTEAGNHTIQWNGLDSQNQSVGSGLYFYQLKTDNKTLHRKMMLLK